MSHVFKAPVYDTTRMPDSWWRQTVAPLAPTPLDGDAETDVAIIGGGYAGLSTALHLARDHGIAATVLEAGDIGWGASGRNGGFVTFPSDKLGLAGMVRRHGRDETRAYLDAGRQASHLVRALLEREAIDADPQGDCNYEVAHSPKAAAGLTEDAAAYAAFGVDVRPLTAAAFAEVGHGGTEAFGALRFGDCFALNPLKYVTGLAQAATRHGAKLHARTAVTGWNAQAGRHVLTTAGGRIRARHVVVACNAYLANGVDRRLDNRTVPALSNIIVTAPLTPDVLVAAGWKTECPIHNTRDLLFYYRLLPDNRFLFGARGGTSGGAAETERLRRWMIRRMGEVFPAFANADITHFWSGLVALTARRTPVITTLPDDATVHVAYGCHAAGVGLMSWAGAQIAGAIAGRAPLSSLPAPYRGQSMALVSPLVRRLGLKSAYLWYGLKDRL